MKVCLVETCSRKCFCGGLCSTHYVRWTCKRDKCRFSPEEDYKPRVRRSEEARKQALMKKVTVTETGCWLLGKELSLNNHLYVDGKKYKTRTAFWLLFRGKGAPPESCVLNEPTCGDLRCVAPDHVKHAISGEWQKGKSWKWSSLPEACEAGHEYTPENTSFITVSKTGKTTRRCKACKSASSKRYRESKKGKKS